MIIVRGVALCEPCAVLGHAPSTASLAPPAVVQGWVGHGGLRVDILDDGDVLRDARVEVGIRDGD